VDENDTHINTYKEAIRAKRKQKFPSLPLSQFSHTPPPMTTPTYLHTHIYHSPSFLYSVLPSTSCASSKQKKSKNQQKQNYTAKRPKQRPSTLTHTHVYIYHIDQYWWLNSDAMEIERGMRVFYDTHILFFSTLSPAYPLLPLPIPSHTPKKHQRIYPTLVKQVFSHCKQGHEEKHSTCSIFLSPPLFYDNRACLHLHINSLYSIILRLLQWGLS
jgi:hypothetical protein